MGLRFRRSVRLFPGVRLNFSGSGVSTTIGVRGAGITLGPHGAYANVGLPGTGLSYRTRISPAPTEHSSHSERSFDTSLPSIRYPEINPPQPAVHTEGAEQIHSGSVSAMTSPGLSELKRLIDEASLRRTVLTRTVSDRADAVRLKSRKLIFAQRFIVRLFTRKAVPRLKMELDEASSTLETSRAELEGCYVHIDFGLDGESTGTFAALSRSFSNLSSNQKIWDITESAKTDRIKERTTATNRITRSQVAFDFGQVDVIQSDYKSLRLRNASSFEIHLFPGFILTRETGSDFALLEWKEFKAEYAPSRFIETDPVPSDSEVVGYTWAKANKDGSPDRRFSDNYQIPIAKYGELWLKSPTGLYEAYMVSNCQSAQGFGAAISNHSGALARINQIPHEAEPEEAELLEPPTEAPEENAAREQSPRYILDWIALGIISLVIFVAGYWFKNNSDQLFDAIQPARPAAIEAAVTPPALPVFYVVPPALNVRAEPSAKAKIVAKFSSGMRVSVFQVRGGWSQVGEETPRGWVFTALLSRDTPRIKAIDAR